MATSFTIIFGLMTLAALIAWIAVRVADYQLKQTRAFQEHLETYSTPIQLPEEMSMTSFRRYQEQRLEDMINFTPFTDLTDSIDLDDKDVNP